MERTAANVSKLLQRWEQTGSVIPLRQGGGAKPKLEEQKLQKMVEQKIDATLGGLSEGLEQEIGLKSKCNKDLSGITKTRLKAQKKIFHDPKQESEEAKPQTCFLGNHHKELTPSHALTNKSLLLEDILVLLQEFKEQSYKLSISDRPAVKSHLLNY